MWAKGSGTGKKARTWASPSPTEEKAWGTRGGTTMVWLGPTRWVVVAQAGLQCTFQHDDELVHLVVVEGGACAGADLTVGEGAGDALVGAGDVPHAVVGTPGGLRDGSVVDDGHHSPFQRACLAAGLGEDPHPRPLPGEMFAQLPSWRGPPTRPVFFLLGTMPPAPQWGRPTSALDSGSEAGMTVVQRSPGGEGRGGKGGAP